jgi:hypothetical protein
VRLLLLLLMRHFDITSTGRYAERDVKNRRHHQEEISLFEFAASSSVSINSRIFLI